MNVKLAASCLMAAASLLPIAAYAAESSPKVYAEDTVITTKIKAELAKEKMSSLVHIDVDTINQGNVVLSGTAKSQQAIDKALSIARGVKGVTNVENRIHIAAEK
jgi:hyperosmotically inducible periplasmic protein